MKATGYDKRLLLQKIQNARQELIGHRQKRAQPLLADLDALEKRVKKTKANQKFAYRMDIAQLDAIIVKIDTWHKRNALRFSQSINWIALFFGVFMLTLYIAAGIVHASIPQTTMDLTAWLTIGIGTGIAAMLTFILYCHAHIQAFAYLMRNIRNCRNFWVRIYLVSWYNLLMFSYINMFGIILTTTLNWVYPSSFPFLRDFYDGAITGAAQGNILSAILILITVIGAIISFVQAVYSTVKFAGKLFRKKTTV